MTEPARRQEITTGDARSDAAAGDGADVSTDVVDERHPAAASRRLELLCAGAALVLSVGLVLGARGIDLRTETGGIDPRWWPTVLGWVGAVLSAALLAVSALRPVADRGETQSATREGWQRLAIAVGAAVVLIVAWPLVGFIPALAVFLAGLTFLLGGRGWAPLIAFPVITAGGLYLLFAVGLEVPL